MAGLNKSLKAGTVVFKAGENADGMYLVRKGELVVYLEQGGKEVILAKISEGGMVGEMALFDRMPRSASVKASVDTEITHISLDDFSKLMKQIPKWFLGLMSALSGRLRTTNERLNGIEAKGGGAPPPAVGLDGKIAEKPFQSIKRILHIMELLWHRDGAKDGKDWTIQRKVLEDEICGIFGEPPAKILTLLDLLCTEKILLAKQDSYKNNVMAMPNRGSLRQFTTFLTDFTKSNPTMLGTPEPLMNILQMIIKIAAKAPYDEFTVTLEELEAEAKAAEINSHNWKDMMPIIAGLGGGLKATKTSTNSGLGLRVVKTDVATLVKNLTTFNKLAQRKLDQ